MLIELKKSSSSSGILYSLVVLQSDGYQTAILLSSAEDFGIALKGYLLEQSEGVASYFTLGQQIWWPLRVPVSAQRRVFKMKRVVSESKFFDTRLLTTHGENVPMCPSELRKLVELWYLPRAYQQRVKSLVPLLGHLPRVTCVPFGKIDVLTLAP